MLDMLDAVSAFGVEIRLSVLDQDLPSSPASSRRRITLKGFHCCGIPQRDQRSLSGRVSTKSSFHSEALADR